MCLSVLTDSVYTYIIGSTITLPYLPGIVKAYTPSVSGI